MLSLCGTLVVPIVVPFAGADPLVHPTPDAAPITKPARPGPAPTPVPPPVPTPQPTPEPTPEPKPETNPEPKATDVSPLRELVGLMSGSFSSAAQHREDPENFFDIRLHMAPIWKDISSDEKGYWLYVEQATAAMPDRPYRQRVYHVTVEHVSDPSGRSTPVFKSAVYLLPGTPAEVLKFTGAWKDEKKLDGVTPEKLIPRDGCTVVMTRTGESRFEGATVGKGCPSERGGAKYATAEVHVNTDGLQTWDRGYNEKDEQVWGAEKGGYRFVRVEDNDETKR